MSYGTNLCAGCAENQAGLNGYCEQCNELERQAEHRIAFDYKTAILFRCPFCGEAPNRDYLEPMTDTSGQVYWVDCRKCRASGGTAKTPQEAADKWNRRTFYGGGDK